MRPTTVCVDRLLLDKYLLTGVDARGHYTIGKEMVDSVIDRIRRVAGKIHSHTTSTSAYAPQTTAPRSRASSSSTLSVVVQVPVSVRFFSSASRPTTARSASSSLPFTRLLASPPRWLSPTTLSSQPTAPLRTPTARSSSTMRPSTISAVAAWIFPAPTTST
jgi:hypothetical protein